MDKFLKYFENNKFVEWVLRPTEELEDYWNEYLKENPSEKEQIELARLLIGQLKSKEEKESSAETVELLSGIIQKLEEKNRQNRFSRIGREVLKYAAVAVLFFSLGIALFMIQKEDRFEQFSAQTEVFQDKENAQLILGDGENVAITEKESTVEYQADGRIIINNRDTMAAKSDTREPQLNQLVVPYGRNSSIKLPDGSTAWLNAGSRLVYPSFFDKDKREVYLIGEGYFEVTHDEKLPFVVKTNDLEVEVLGTQFNLSAYPSDNIIETVLVEGKVRVKETGFQLLKKDYILLPNQRAAYNRENAETKIENVEVDNYVAWHLGFLQFESTDLNRIVKKLERYYNIRIRLEGPMLGMRSISGKLKLKENKENVLQVMANAASAELEKINDFNYVLK